MKQASIYFLLSFALLSMFAGIAYSQSGWVRQYPPSQAQNISFLSVSFAGADTGFIVGGYGTILHTTDGGTHWISQLSGTTQWLRGVTAINGDTATAVGDSGTILRTTNDGAVWERQSSGTTNNLRGVSFANFNIGTVVGDSGNILRTTNGGITWNRQSSGTTSRLGGVSFIDTNIGAAVGDSGTILRTTNGGTTWTNQSISTDYQLLGVSLTDADTGIVLGDYEGGGYTSSSDSPDGPVIIRITNDGILWNAKIPDKLFAPCKYCFPDFIGGVSFTDAITGTVAVWNCIFHTTNGGGEFTDSVKEGEGSWTRQLADTNLYQGVCFTDPNHGTVVGAFGIILHTTTGGVTAVKNTPTQEPKLFVLEQNYPNPFNPTTIITYQLPTNTLVTLKVYDELGRLVKTLFNEVQTAGIHSTNFNASSLSSGAYFFTLTAGGFVQTKRLMFIK